jgi:hypothetical protein
MNKKQLEELKTKILNDTDNKMDFVMYDNPNYIETIYEGSVLILANNTFIVETNKKEYVYKGVFTEDEYNTILKRSRKVDMDEIAEICDNL